jgi:hypothetical protein
MESVKHQESVVTKTPRVWDLRHMDMGDAYDESQTNDSIFAGDVLLVQDGIAILYRAWPTMVFGSSDVFHELGSTSLWEDVITSLTLVSSKTAQLYLDSLLVAWAIACG